MNPRPYMIFVFVGAQIHCARPFYTNQGMINYAPHRFRAGRGESRTPIGIKLRRKPRMSEGVCPQLLPPQQGCS